MMAQISCEVGQIERHALTSEEMFMKLSCYGESKISRRGDANLLREYQLPTRLHFEKFV